MPRRADRRKSPGGLRNTDPQLRCPTGWVAARATDQSPGTEPARRPARRTRIGFRREVNHSFGTAPTTVRYPTSNSFRPRQRRRPRRSTVSTRAHEVPRLDYRARRHSSRALRRPCPESPRKTPHLPKSPARAIAGQLGAGQLRPRREWCPRSSSSIAAESARREDDDTSSIPPSLTSRLLPRPMKSTAIPGARDSARNSATSSASAGT